MQTAIYFWRGCILYSGFPPDLPWHAHLPPAICAGPDAPLSISHDAETNWQSCRTALLASGCEHSVRTHGRRFVSLLVEPGSPESVVLQAELGSRRMLLDPGMGRRFLQTIGELDRIGTGHPQQIRQKLAALFPMAPNTPDPRLHQVIQRVVARPQSSVNARELAHEIGMSESWLLHAFARQLGIPLRRYRLWFRLKRAALLMKAGESVVQAALGAGFYDQAHFQNAFRTMFGLQPGIVLREPSQIFWYVDAEDIAHDSGFAAVGNGTHGRQQNRRLIYR